MTYRISRNGQTYGPYTLDDLRRYVASGNVLLTDLAQGEGESDWLPVSQLLGETPATPQPQTAYPNTGYAQPGYPHAYAPGAIPPEALQYPDSPNLHWGLVLLFSVLTCGVFMVVWNILVTAWLRRVQPNAVALWIYVSVLVLAFLNVGLAVPSAMHQAAGHLNPFTSFLGLLIWALRVYARFSERASLEEHFNGPENIGLRLNPVMVFFFGGLYMQSELNRINERKQAARMAMGMGY